MVGGGFRASRVGELAIARAGVILKAEDIAVDLVAISNDPDEAGLIGAGHLAPSWLFKGHDAILAVDIGGTNIRAGVVHLNLKKAPDLSKGNWQRDGWRWYASYRNLQKHAFYFNNAVFTVPRTTPGKFGARASRLYRMLTSGHNDLKLSEEDLHRIALWLDCNSDFFGAYENIDAQSRGEVVEPSLE